MLLRLQLFEEIEPHFDNPDVTLVDSNRLTEGLGLQIETSSSDPVIADSFLRQARCYNKDRTLSAQIRTLKETNPVEVSVGNSPSIVLKPGQLHKKSLPELLKADLWSRAILEKGKLAEVLALVDDYKQVEKDGVKYYFDEDLDWLIQDDADSVTVYGKSEKHGLLKEVRQKVTQGNPSAAFKSLKTCLEAEIDLLEKALSAPSLTEHRRELMLLELATDTLATELID